MSASLAAGARCSALLTAIAHAMALTALAACSVDEGKNPAFKNCRRNSDCGEHMKCRRGYCYADGSAGIDGSTGGAGAPSDAGRQDGGEDEDGGDEPQAPAPCMPADAGDELVTEFCYTGPEGTAVVGLCKAGTRTCFRDEGSPTGGYWGPCTDEIVPAEHELCNGEDDDCDDATDEVMSFATCDTRMLGQCMEGRVICDQGSAICAVITTPTVEQCNGEDDDCDGKTDEGDVAQASCYTATAGCQDGNGDGVFECLGVCRAGVQQCMEGAMQPCTGAVEPAAAEDCELNDGLADDDDCDGTIDEGCNCTASEQRFCYSGPAGTHENAPCRRGTQTCSASGQWEGECAGEVLPAEETCANQGADDDCDGEPDDVPMLGFACDNPDENAMGRCATGIRDCVAGALQCVTPEPREEMCDATDDDCMGGVDEGFNLQDDEQNCGTCANACTGATLTCCDGTCVNTNTDERYCGGCGSDRRCGSNMTCCGGVCVDLQSDEAHCGDCNATPCGGLTATCCRGACAALCL